MACSESMGLGLPHRKACSTLPSASSLANNFPEFVAQLRARIEHHVSASKCHQRNRAWMRCTARRYTIVSGSEKTYHECSIERGYCQCTSSYLDVYKFWYLYL